MKSAFLSCPFRAKSLSANSGSFVITIENQAANFYLRISTKSVPPRERYHNSFLCCKITLTDIDTFPYYGLLSKESTKA